MKDKLQFWSKSSDKPPGEGTGEYVKNINNYKVLSSIKNWRKKLINNYKISIFLNNKKFNSVEDFLFEFKKYYTTNENIMKDAATFAMFAKFTQHSSMKKILLATKDSELYYYGRKPILLDNLMKIRDCIKKYDKKYNLSKVSLFNGDIIKDVLNISDNSLFEEEEIEKKEKFYAWDKVTVKYINENKNEYKNGEVVSRMTFGKDVSYEIKLDENGKIIKVQAENVFKR